MALLDDRVVSLLSGTAPAHDEIQREMQQYAEEEGFPIIGPTAGGVLRLLARLTAAERIFEFGSGYGYSAYWFLKGMADDGTIVLTEIDEDELAMGEAFFERAGLADRATFELGDALSIVDRYDGPFDAVLVDHQKHRYAEAFETVAPKVRVGGVIVADNVMRGPIDLDVLAAHFEDGDPLPSTDEDKETEGIGRYLETAREHPAFETIVLPIGSGLAISCKIEES